MYLKRICVHIKLDIMVMPAAENKVNLREYKNLIETIAKVEYQKFSVSHLVDLPELINIGTHALYILFKSNSPENYNNTYLSTAIKWAIRNEIRRRYRWYTMKNTQPVNDSEVREVVYKSIVSVEAMAEADNPVIVKDTSMTPSEQAEFDELKIRIKEAIKKSNRALGVPVFGGCKYGSTV